MSILITKIFNNELILFLRHIGNLKNKIRYVIILNKEILENEKLYSI